MLVEASKLVKEFDVTGFTHWGIPGIRAQLVDIRNLQLVYDFVVEGDERSVHILNAISPAFTATLVKRIVSPYKISLQTFASIRIKQT
ncbi:hypothetical protein [Thermodesulfobacterium hveragerdense]|uniref:hypothetical protein n=1 Tax=Thermodesulfobacterium hveragerdense TaxID=53424 RepID=UPI00048DB684|nr:hypothetical protein [Thermodesulfobacterium hveragerdense]